MERELLLLGMLLRDEMYGYQINETIDTHLGSSIHLTKPTAYRILKQMAEGGLVSFREEKEGNRPTRRIFKITEAGRTEFKELLNKSLSQFKMMENANAIPLAHLGELSKKGARTLLEERLSKMSKLLEESFDELNHQGTYQLVVENRILHLSAELEWLKEVIARL